MNKARWKNEEMQVWWSPSPLGELPKGYLTASSSSVPSAKGKNHVGERMEHSKDSPVVLQCSVGSLKITQLKHTQCQGKKAMTVTKRRLVEWFDEPDLLRQVAFHSKFLVSINTFWTFNLVSTSYLFFIISIILGIETSFL